MTSTVVRVKKTSKTKIGFSTLRWSRAPAEDWRAPPRGVEGTSPTSGWLCSELAVVRRTSCVLGVLFSIGRCLVAAALAMFDSDPCITMATSGVMDSYLAMEKGSWEAFKERCRKEEKSSEWTLERIREACEKVAKDEIGCLGLVQEILRKSTDFLRRVIAPVGGMGAVTLSYVCPDCNSFPLEDNTWFVSTGH